MTGLLIAFEGPEGAGKTTQIARLAEALQGEGHKVCLTREPGGTPLGERLREIMLDPVAALSPLAEALLMNAARDAHLREVIDPARGRDEVVLCDRFTLSTRAYQGAGGGLAEEAIMALERLTVTKGADLTVVLDLAPDDGLARAAVRGRLDRFERMGTDYHARVAAAFRSMAAEDPRAILIDADGSEDEVAARIAAAVRPVLTR